VQAINQAYGTTVLLVTHDPSVASRMDRVVTMRDGRASTEIRRQRNGDEASPQSVLQEEWVILDPVGRLQLPRACVNTLEMRELVKVHLEPDHISIWPRKGREERPDKVRRSKGDMPGLPVSQFWRAAESPNPPVNTAVAVENLSRTFDLAGEEVHALHDVSLEIPSGCLSVIKGPSGSGKTTLLHLIAGLDEPTAGRVRVGERWLVGMSAQDKVGMIQEQIGFVFQTFGLLPFLTVEENVEVPLRLLYTAPVERQVRVREMLEVVGLEDRAEHRTYELSGGEQQRVAIARALVKQPTLLLADEPTGQLDSLTGESIIALLKRVARQGGVTVVVASHDPNVHEAADWIFELRDGRLLGTANQAG
jgi:putative ABC transport system ATP-binding protein